MGNKLDNDSKDMEKGIDRLLGKVPYETRAPRNPCEHYDDGYVYGETVTRMTLRCEKCGEFYEEDK